MEEKKEKLEKQRKEKVKEQEEEETRAMASPHRKPNRKFGKPKVDIFEQNITWLDEREKKKFNAKLQNIDKQLNACKFKPDTNVEYNNRVTTTGFFERQSSYLKRKQQKNQSLTKKVEQYDFKPKLNEKSLRMCEEKSTRSQFNKTNQNSPRFYDANDSFVIGDISNRGTPNRSQRCKTPNERLVNNRKYSEVAMNRLNKPFRNKANNLYLVAEIPEQTSKDKNDDYIQLNHYDKNSSKDTFNNGLYMVH